MRSSRVRMAMIWRAYSLGHVTFVCRDGREVDAQLFGQPADAGLFHPGRLAVLHAELVVVPLAGLDAQVIAVAAGVGRQVPLVQQAFFLHASDELWSGEAELGCGLGEVAFHGAPYAACAAGVAAAARWLMDSVTLP